MSRLEKHLGKGEKIIVNEDEFWIKPLTIDELPQFFKMMKGFSKFKEDTPLDEVLSGLDDSSLEAMKYLLNLTLERSLPEENEYDRKAFGFKNMPVILEAMIKLNSADMNTIEDKKKNLVVERMRLMREAQEAKKNEEVPVNKG